MTQWIGIAVIAAGVVWLAIQLWKYWLSKTSLGTTTAGKVVTSLFSSAEASVGLGSVEALRQLKTVQDSPECLKACSTLADFLWLSMKDSWTKAQTTQAATNTVSAKLPDGTIVQVVVDSLPSTGVKV